MNSSVFGHTDTFQSGWDTISTSAPLFVGLGDPAPGAGAFASAELDMTLGVGGGTGNGAVVFGGFELGVGRGGEVVQQQVAQPQYVRPPAAPQRQWRFNRYQWQKGLVATCRHLASGNLVVWYHSLSAGEQLWVNQQISQWSAGACPMHVSVAECQSAAQ